MQAMLVRSRGALFALAFFSAALHASPPDWRPLPGTNGVVDAMAVYDAGEGPVLVAAGNFTDAGGTPANRIAYWDGSSWHALGAGLDGPVYALATFDDGTGTRLYAGGTFNTAGSVTTRAIAVWDGANWSAPASGGADGGTDVVLALATFDSDGAGPVPARLVVGGRFGSLGGVAAGNTAALSSGAWSNFGGGRDGAVMSLDVYNGQLYAGGEFPSGGRLVRSNGGNWTQFTSGFGNGSDYIDDLEVFAGTGTPRLYAAGQFFSAAGVTAHNVTATEGANFFYALGTVPNEGTSQPAGALATFDDGEETRLYVGGGFGTVGGNVAASNVAAWSGSAWSAMGQGTNGGVNVLFAMPDDATGPSLYVGGFFANAGGQSSPSIARWARDDHARLRVVIVGSAAAGSRVVSGETPAPLLDCPGQCDATYDVGTTGVTLLAQPAPGAVFAGYEGGCFGPDEQLVLAMSQPRRCVARFENARQLDIVLAGSGQGSVTSVPAGIDCGATCSAQMPQDQTVLLTATAAPGSSFGGWSGDCTVNDPLTAVVMDVDRSCTATFRLRHTLTVGSVTGGFVISWPEAIECPGAACAADFDEGTTVLLSAVTSAGFRFAQWSGDCSGSGVEVNVQMLGARTCTPSYVVVHALTVDKAGPGDGHVGSFLPGIDCGLQCSALFDTGSSVTLTATPAQGSYFVQWSGACAGTDANAVVVLSQPAQCTAQFGNVRQLGFTLSGQGRVRVPAAGLDCSTDCSTGVGHQTPLQITAEPSAGWRFSGWGGSCASAGANPVIDLQIVADLQCSASFVKTWPLGVVLAGTGQGSVGSAPAGIGCAPACIADFDEGSQVVLTATADFGSVFTGWEGDCNGTASASVTMTQARSCTARFAPRVLLEVVNIGDGTITSPQLDFDCGGPTCFIFVAQGTQVTLIATPSPGASFVQWHVGCGGTDPVLDFSLDANRYCAAEFAGGYRVFASGFE